ncbi:MAG: hypothetical protein ACE5HT_12340 [Gemmatimonadales bacterium]
MAVIRERCEAPEFGAQTSVLWDLRQARTDKLTAADLAAIVEEAGIPTDAESVRWGRVAFVASRPVDFGVARMYQVLSERIPFERKVFSEFSDAWSWLLEEQN